jgi:uncharacterized protein
MLTIEKARSWYRANDPVHGFDHVLRVTILAERLARAEGADVEIVRAAALLHDASPPALEQREDLRRSNHHLGSAGLAAEVLSAEGWPAEKILAVQHCILAHRFRDDSTRPSTLEAEVLFDADKLDAIGAVGVARAIAYAVNAGLPFYAHPSPGFAADGVLDPGEPHSAYHEYLFKLVKIRERLNTNTAQRWAEERQQRMVAFFQGLAEEIDLEEP